MKTRTLLAMMLMAATPLDTATAQSQQADQQSDDQQGATAQGGADDDDGPAVIPWQAEIYSNFTGWTQEELAARDPWDLAHRCGGTLIADGWVLTAAHCIDQGKVDKGYRVRLGTSSLDANEGVTFRIDRMVRHADYDKPSHRNDIALVHYVADRETRVGSAAPIEALPIYRGGRLAVGTKVYASGWGQEDEAKDSGFSADLTTVNLNVVRCEDFKQYRGKTDDNMMCARSPDNDDTCTGDSGGPLVLDQENPELVGIVSWGIGCYRENSAGVYVRLDADHFADWIDRAMAVDPSVNTLD